MAKVSIRLDKKSAFKVGAGLLGAVATMNPAPAAMAVAELAGAAELASDTRFRRRVSSRFAGNAQDLTPKQREVVLGWANDAVAAAHFDVVTAVQHSLDAAQATDHVSALLQDWRCVLDDTECRWTQRALRAYMDEYMGHLLADAARWVPAFLTVSGMTKARPKQVGAETIAEQVRTHAKQRLREALQHRRLTDPLALAPITSTATVGDALLHALPTIADSWTHRLVEALDRVLGGMAFVDAQQVGRPLRDLRQVARSGQCLPAWTELRGPRVTDAIRGCRQLRNTAPAATRGGEALSGLSWLETQANQPDFRVVTAIHGTWGSGKSRLIDDFVAQACAPQSRDLVILIRDGASHVQKALFAALSESTRVPIVTWDDARDATAGHETTWFAIDDADAVLASDPLWIRHLADCVTASLSMPVRWLITVDTASVPDMASTRGSFWHQVGIRHGDEIGQPPGWFDLDEYNSRKQVGRALVESGHNLQSHEIDLSRLVPERARGLTRYETRTANHPLTALLRAGIGPDTAIDQLHYSDVFSQYWDLALDALASRESTSPELVDEVARVVAADLRAGAPSPLENLPRRVLDGPMSPAAEGAVERLDLNAATGAAERALRALLRSGLLVHRQNAAVPSLTAVTLWGYLITRDILSPEARSEVRDDYELAEQRWQEALDTLLILHMQGNEHAVAGLRFLLLQAADHVGLARTGSLWRRGVAEPAFPTSTVWETSPALPFGSLIGLMKHARKEGGHPRDVYWLMRLFLLRPPGNDELKLALDLLALRGQWIVPSGLADYADHVIGALIANVDWCRSKARHTLLASLSSLDSRGLAAMVAARIVRTINFDDHAQRREWFATLRRLLAHTSDPGSDEGVGDALLDRMPFWLALARLSLESLSENVDAREFMNLLDRVGWWSTRNRVGSLLLRETQTTLGHSRHNGLGAFVRVVDELAHGRRARSMDVTRQPAAAAFAIKHTVRTTGRTEYLVDGALAPVVGYLKKRGTASTKADDALSRIRFDTKAPP